MLSTLCALLVAVFAAPADVSGQPVTLNIWAVQAVKMGNAQKRFEGVADPVRRAIEDLPYDTFRAVFSGLADVAIGGERRVRLDEMYTLVVQCRSRDGKDAAHVDLTVELAASSQGGAPRKALQSCMVLCKDRLVRLGGLKMKEGDMVVVLEMTR